SSCPSSALPREKQNSPSIAWWGYPGAGVTTCTPSSSSWRKPSSGRASNSSMVVTAVSRVGMAIISDSSTDEGKPCFDRNGRPPRGMARAATGRDARQQDPLAAFRARIGAVPIQAQPLAENLTLLSGPGGNVVVLRGADGLVMVDTFVSPAWPKLQESLKGLGAPVKFVINTHWHFDHTDINAPLHAAGATLVAHENT